MNLQQLEKRIFELETRLRLLENDTTIPLEVYTAFKSRFVLDFIEAKPLPSITAPSGGLTVDSSARTAINTIITRLESLGLVNPN